MNIKNASRLTCTMKKLEFLNPICRRIVDWYGQHMFRFFSHDAINSAFVLATPASVKITQTLDYF